jgi:hypothetical protein
MNVNESMAVVSQLKLIVDLAQKFNISREGVIRGILDLVADLEDQADELDAAMYDELGAAYEKYDDAMVVGA